MARTLTVAGLALLALALIAAYAVLLPGEAWRPPPEGVAEPVLEELAAPFVHRWSKGTSHPLLAAAAIDIDGDGRDEVFLGGSDGQGDALLALREGALVDIAAEAGLGDRQATYGALSIDLTGDGKVDLVTAGRAGLDLWINKGGRFERRHIALALPPEAVPLAVSAGDFDRDGLVDLYVSAFVEAKSFRSTVFNDPAHAKTNLLLRNIGGGAFLDATGRTARGRQNTFTASFADLDGDRWPDLVLAQNTGEVEILRNERDGTFSLARFRSGYGFWMGLAIADLDGDGDLDIFLSNIGNSVPPRLVKGDLRKDQTFAAQWLLLRNDGGFAFTDITEAAGLSGFGFAWGAAFTDLNLDGALDLLVAENYVKWPPHLLVKLPGKLLLGAGGAEPRFYTSDKAANPAFGHTPLLADLDGDGRLDVVWANMAGAPRVYLNRTPGRFIAVRLPDTPASVGARVTLEGGAAPIYTHIAGQGLTSDQAPQVTLGLPKGESAPAALSVEWADGTVTRIEAPKLDRQIAAPAPQKAP